MRIFFPNSLRIDGDTHIFPTHGLLEIFPVKAATKVTHNKAVLMIWILKNNICYSWTQLPAWHKHHEKIQWKFWKVYILLVRNLQIMHPGYESETEHLVVGIMGYVSIRYFPKYLVSDLKTVELEGKETGLKILFLVVSRFNDFNRWIQRRI